MSSRRLSRATQTPGARFRCSTCYEFAAGGDGNFGIVQDSALMTRFWADLQLLADKLKAFDKPAIVHLEPDFGAMPSANSPGNDRPSSQRR